MRVRKRITRVGAVTSRKRRKQKRPLRESGPTIQDLIKSGPVQAHASSFVKMHSELLDDESKRMIASLAFRAGVVLVLKVSERVLGDFGASTIFEALGEVSNQDMSSVDANANPVSCSPNSLSAPAAGDKVQRGNRMDPMFG